MPTGGSRISPIGRDIRVPLDRTFGVPGDDNAALPGGTGMNFLEVSVPSVELLQA
jgi:hypothetical protein